MSSCEEVTVPYRHWWLPKRLIAENKQEAERVLVENAENSDDEEDATSISNYDDYDASYVPTFKDGDISDVEGNFDVEIVEEDSSEDEDEIELLREDAVQAIAATSDAGPGDASEPPHYKSKSGVKWFHHPPPVPRVQPDNVVDFTPNSSGPSSGLICDPLAIFMSIMTEDIMNIIIRETNRNANQIVAKWNVKNPTKIMEWLPLNLDEFKAFLGILLHAGCDGSNSSSAIHMWGSATFPLYNASLTYNRFMSISKFIRFDNSNTRPQRLLTSKTAAIDDIWTMTMANLEKAYTPHESITVDAQLFAYRGCSPFTQCILSNTYPIPPNPAKFGIKVWWACDSKSFYPLKGNIYVGKEPGVDHEANQDHSVLLSLVENFKGSGRTIYANNCFSSLDLANTLMTKKLAFVGPVRSDKTFVPPDFLANKSRSIYSSMFGFQNNDVCLMSYVPKKAKSDILISTAHYHCDVELNNAKRKPLAMVDYKSHKSGVAKMSKMLEMNTCKRETRRWSLAMFYELVDVAALAAYIIFNEMKPKKKSDARREFLRELAKQLAMKNIEARARDPHICRYTRWSMTAFGFAVSVIKSNSNTLPS